MVSYTRSRAESNAVIERSVNQPLSVSADTGPLPWDAPNRLLSWGYLPAWSKSYAVGYMLDWHTGLPFSIQDQYGEVAGAADSMRYPEYFQFNVFLERVSERTRLPLGGARGHEQPHESLQPGDGGQRAGQPDLSEQVQWSAEVREFHPSIHRPAAIARGASGSRPIRFLEIKTHHGLALRPAVHRCRHGCGGYPCDST